jgi:hypothetical protein
MPHRRVSPEFFSALQWFSLALPLSIFLGIAAAIAIFMHGNESLYTSLLQSLFFIVTGGGIAMMYFVWWMSMTFRGIVATPKTPWEICVIADIIKIKSKRFEVTFPISQPNEYIHVWDGNFDQIQGLEDEGLLIDFGHIFRIVVPGSSINFKAALAHIETFRPVRTKIVD